jgi:hypothetical protein
MVPIGPVVRNITSHKPLESVWISLDDDKSSPKVLWRFTKIFFRIIRIRFLNDESFIALQLLTKTRKEKATRYFF